MPTMESRHLTAVWSRALFNRTFGALLGGLALILPMIIMTIPSASVQKSLVVSSLSVLSIAFIVARISQGSWKDVLGITAAYAAVLVMFVGTENERTLRDMAMMRSNESSILFREL